MTEAEFWNKAREVGAKATWAYLATTIGNQPKVRVVTPRNRGQARVGGDRTKFGEGKTDREKPAGRALLSNWIRHGSSNHHRASEVHRGSHLKKASLGEQDFRLRLGTVLAAGS